MVSRIDEVIKRAENLQDKGEGKEHSLQENALERAKHAHTLNVGTAYDWEDLDAYQQELERLDREGPLKVNKSVVAPDQDAKK